jgi:purine-nucleoside phosphorylase
MAREVEPGSADPAGPDIPGAVRALEELGLCGPEIPGPELLLVLGSGLGGLVESMERERSVSLSDLPGFPPAGVAGHAGRLHLGRLGGREVLVQAGRYHYYEGHPDSVVAAPLRLAAALGIEGVLLTNAAGGMGGSLVPGRPMIIDDHLNLLWRNPLRGPGEEGETRFSDMSEPYDRGLQALAEQVAFEQGLRVERGTYAAVLGPSYETPAEIRMLRRMGADAVGMSTVPEVLVARARGLPVLGISVITNFAAGISPEPLDHDEVVTVGAEVGPALQAWVTEVVRRWPQSPARGETR